MNSMSTPSSTPQIIVAEDDTDDQKLLMEAFTENQVIETAITFVQDGIELIDTLAKLAVRPTIILLDLNMPKMDGREALRKIKSDEQFRHIPVLIFTTSRSNQDIRLAYEHGGNSFFTKPAMFDDLVKTIGVIKNYWFEKALLPGTSDGHRLA